MIATLKRPLSEQQRPFALPPKKTARNSHEPIMVASDGTSSADLAVSAARLLARAAGAPIQIVSVLEPVSSLAPAPLLAGLPPNVDATRAGERLNAIREQRRMAGGDGGWSIEVKFGDPAPTLARVAKERTARMIVMGLNRHGTVDRILGGDTVFDVVRIGEAPVFVATEKMDELPRTVVIGVDFSPLSTYAAELAVSLFPQAERVHLVHVRPVVETPIDGWNALPYAGAAQADFSGVLEAIPEAADRVETVELIGANPARELARYAREVHADLLVVGSYKRGLFRRLATGAMAGRVLREAPCPVLVVPEPPRTPARVEERKREVHREALVAQLRGITERNTGRRAIVEIDQPAIGAQALAFDYAFLGMDYDWHTDRTQLYLGEIGDGGARHATHVIPHPEVVDVLRGMDGRDQVVRIADGSGQALVTFW